VLRTASATRTMSDRTIQGRGVGIGDVHVVFLMLSLPRLSDPIKLVSPFQGLAWVADSAWDGGSVVSSIPFMRVTRLCVKGGTVSLRTCLFPGGNLGLLGLGVGGGCGLGIGLGWGVGVGWGSKYINQHFVFEETKTSRRLNDDSPQVRVSCRASYPLTMLLLRINSALRYWLDALLFLPNILTNEITSCRQVRNPVTSLVRGVKSTFSRTRTSKDSDDSHRE
jgi:hypothetical protein